MSVDGNVYHLHQMPVFKLFVKFHFQVGNTNLIAFQQVKQIMVYLICRSANKPRLLFVLLSAPRPFYLKKGQPSPASAVANLLWYPDT